MCMVHKLGYNQSYQGILLKARSTKCVWKNPTQNSPNWRFSLIIEPVNSSAGDKVIFISAEPPNEPLVW